VRRGKPQVRQSERRLVDVVPSIFSAFSVPLACQRIACWKGGSRDAPIVQERIISAGFISAQPGSFQEMAPRVYQKIADTHQFQNRGHRPGCFRKQAKNSHDFHFFVNGAVEGATSARENEVGRLPTPV
jgi:hypothetical protein